MRTRLALAAAAVVAALAVALLLRGADGSGSGEVAKAVLAAGEGAPEHSARAGRRAEGRTSGGHGLITHPARVPQDQLRHRRPVGDRPEPPEGAPNVVVVLGCTLRRDELAPYGGLPEVTPWLAEAAARGVVFDDTIAASSWTKESSTAIFTGHQALGVGMVEPEPHHSVRVLSDRVETLAERLATAGWTTIGVTANPHLNTDFGLAQGFDQYRDTASAGFARRNKIDGSEVVAAALAMLDAREQPERPFYLRLVLIDPHVPLAVDASEVAPFEGPDVPPRLATYRAGVHRVDRALAQLEEGLAARGHDGRDTVFVLVADHGEGLSLPPHHRDQHGRVLYPSVTRVPWIVRGPMVAAGERITGLTSHLDVMPTLLGLLDLPADDLPGHDLSPLLAGGGHSTRTRAFTDTWYFGANRSAVFTPSRACQLDWGSTGIRDDTFVEGCFDRATDPDFVHAFQDPALLEELEAWRSARAAEYEAWPDVRDVGRSDEVSRQLEALGYVE